MKNARKKQKKILRFISTGLVVYQSKTLRQNRRLTLKMVLQGYSELFHMNLKSTFYQLPFQI